MNSVSTNGTPYRVTLQSCCAIAAVWRNLSRHEAHRVNDVVRFGSFLLVWQLSGKYSIKFGCTRHKVRHKFHVSQSSKLPCT